MNTPTIKCLIVEDEPPAQVLLEHNIRQLPQLELVGIASNAFEAQELLDSTKPDLIFLDVNLPLLSGIDWLRSMRTQPANVIITTANEQYAIKGYEFNVVDFMLKPCTMEKLDRALNRLNERLSLKRLTEKETETIDVKVTKGVLKIPHADIQTIEAKDDFVRITHGQKRTDTRMRLSAFEEKLPSPPFIRLNRSIIVHENSVKLLSHLGVILKNNEIIPVTPKYLPTIKRLIAQINER